MYSGEKFTLEELMQSCENQLMPIAKNSIGDYLIPQLGEIVFNKMSYRSSETVQRFEYFQSNVSYIKVQIV